MLLFILGLLVALQGDARLEGAALTKFLRSKGASHANRAVHWHVPAKTFLATPRRGRRGFLLFEHQGIGIVVASGSRELAEVRRRGGTACVRGAVRPVPKPEKGGPRYYVSVRQLRRRKT